MRACLASLTVLVIGLAVFQPRAAAAGGATLTVTVLQQDGKPMPGAVVTVHSLDGAAKPSAPVRAIMDQVNRMFTPDLLVIPVGSTVEFPNSDTTRHEIYSFSPAHRFQLPLYRGKPYPPEHFDKPGLVTLGCNIHDFMIAYILVTDASFYGLTDASGAWTASGLPRGRYRIEVWHPRLASGADGPTRELTFGDADRVDLRIRLDRPLQPARLDSHRSSWDAY